MCRATQWQRSREAGGRRRAATSVWAGEAVLVARGSGRAVMMYVYVSR